MMKNYGFILPGNPHDTLPFAAGRPCAAAGSWSDNLLLLLPLPTQPVMHDIAHCCSVQMAVECL
jgi:hypothetical protein